jgi:2-dehydro-3-deoxyphosphogluconate aldolase / (4S)-4-hydroxy-2-oxoglutarate aldolase
MTEDKMIAAIKEQGMLPLFYHPEKQVCINVVKILYKQGINMVEFTNRGANALENFKALVTLKSAQMPNLLLAAGTITSAAQAHDFLAAGADCLISPVFDEEVCDVAYLQKVLWIPGCMTPTEIHTAAKAGCKLIKLFPGNILGPGFVSSIKELFPGVSFMPTGGVEASTENIMAWFTAGVCAVGMGSKLIDREILEMGNYELLKQRTAVLKGLIAEAKKE